MEQRPVCLSVGGSDSCAGAGIQADLRVFEALGVHGCSAITALTAQNPDEILHIQASSIPQFEVELQAITSYYDVSCIKTGMLYDQTHLETLLSFVGDTTLIIDPVLIASSGTFLFDQGAAKTAYEKLLAHATLWTPNLEEGAFFLGTNIQQTEQAAKALQQKYKIPVLLKGGHGDNNVLQDIYCDNQGKVQIFEHPKQALKTSATHGTGCRLASAVAAYLSLGEDLESAVSQAHDWLQSQLALSTE